MDLVEVDGVDAEAAQRSLKFFGQRRGLERAVDGAVGVPAERTLGEDVGFAGRGFNGAPNDFLGVAQAVDGGGVDPVDAKIEGAMDGADGFVSS